MPPTLVTITAHKLVPTGAAATGFVTFMPNTVWRLPNDDRGVPQVTVRRELVAGALNPALQLIATDTAGITVDSGSSPRYRVECHIVGLARPKVSYIHVPAASPGGTLDLADAPDVGP